MVKYLIARPIAVFLAFIVSVVFGFFLFYKIPVSLLPSIDVSQIIVKINYPNTALDVIEQNVTKPLRESFASLPKIENVQSESTNHTAAITLTFEQGTKMDMAYIAVNEKLDYLSGSLPKDLQRPQVIKINTADIPIVNIQVIPKNEAEYLKIAELTEKIIKRRIEQIDGVSIVDINGKQNEVIAIMVNKPALIAANLTENDLEKAIINANTELGSLSVKDGQYRYFVKLSNRLEDVDQIAAIPIRLSNGTISNIGQFTNLSITPQAPQGYHLYNGQNGLIIKVQKQASSRMNELMPKIDTLINQLKKDYPSIDFAITQNQNYLLDQGIQNLTQDLWYGGIFCVLLLFLFIGNYGTPLLMSVSIPISLLISFIFFYLFEISFNIISLSGMALGIGMLIDNSIVVLDSINRKRSEGLSIDQSCIIGVSDVASPVISNVLTTVAIYLPLIYMSGLAGALVSDQAIALTISLGVSLLVSFGLNPVMYSFFFKFFPKKINEDTQIFLAVSKAYERMIHHIFNRKKIYFAISILLMPVGFILFKFIPITTLPKITTTETQLKIDWNEPIDAFENKERLRLLGNALSQKVEVWEADAGIKQYLLQQGANSIQQSEIYYKCKSTGQKDSTDRFVNQWIAKNYPYALYKIQAAPNAFTQLFENDEPYLEVRFRANSKLLQDSVSDIATQILHQTKLPYQKGNGFSNEQKIELTLSKNKMALYQVTYENIQLVLKNLFGKGNISEIRRFGDSKSIQFSNDDLPIASKLTALVKNENGQYYPLSTFIEYSNQNEEKFIQADLTGPYYGASFKRENLDNIEELTALISSKASQRGLAVSFAGEYFYNKLLMNDLLVVFAISILLLYFILAVQFENLSYPFLVMLTIPLGISGAMLMLYLTGETFNVMSAIGFIVVLGIIVDDPSLKIETINRLRKEYLAKGMRNDAAMLLKALHEAGRICLKPLLLVSLTTSLALLPVLFSSGIGNELQKPLVYVIIGGLTVGTFFTLWFIPLAYWFITKKEK